MLFNITNDLFANELDITGEAAILIDADTGEILYEKNPHKSMYPASTTKMLTGILAIENGNLTDKVIVDKNSPFEIMGTHIALDVGEELTLDDLLNALLIESANDAGQVIAKHISGSVEEFSELMNKKAKEIGAKNTNFTNPHGLHDDNHTSTAYDLAMIAKYAMENETFRSKVSKVRETIEPTNKQSETRYLTNGNKILYGQGNGYKINVDGKYIDMKYEGATGVKTGYTSKAMNCLVSSASRGGQNLIAVVLKAPRTEVWSDTHKLLNFGFNNFENIKVASKREFIQNIDVANGNIPFVTGIVDQDVFVNIRKSDEGKITKNVVLSDKISAPISVGQVIGKIEWKIDDSILTISNVVAASSSDLTPVQEAIIKATDKFKVNIKVVMIIIAILFITLRIYISILKRKRRKQRREKKYHF